MPAQSTLSDADVDDVIAYIQSGFAAPSTPEVVVETGPVAGTELPPFANMTIVAAFASSGSSSSCSAPGRRGPRSAHAHLGRRLAEDRRDRRRLDRALVFVRPEVLELDAVQDLRRAAQDLIAVGLWSAGLAAGCRRSGTPTGRSGSDVR